MKKINLLFIVFVSSILSLKSQDPGDINPFVNAIAYTPTNSNGYLPGNFTCGATLVATFNVGQTTSLFSMPPQASDPGAPGSSTPLNGFNNLIVTFTITNLAFNGTVVVGGSASAVVSGAYSSFFNWTYFNANTIVGRQSAIIPPFSVIPPAGAGQIRIALAVPNQSNCINCIVMNSTLTIPSYIIQLPGQDGDDAVQTNASFDCRSLPIQALNFSTLDKQTSGIMLGWKTLNEQNTLEFEIERKYSSEDAWMTIGKKAAAGQSNIELRYEFNDLTYAAKDKIYYRIKQIDRNGTFNYTEIKSIILKNASSIGLVGYPNPAKDLFHLSFISKIDGKVSIDIHDILGRLVSKQSTTVRSGTNYHDLSMSSYAPGTYIVRVSGPDINESLTVVKME